ncbi:hypothetical protein [Dehalobacter restrictus]|uniref:hypothetical protein n=1 Tax=Dehalobacter restrictus TaxID=55583 RepID=UPI00338FEE1D
MLLRVWRLKRSLRNNLENLKVALGLCSIVDSVGTIAEAKKICDWSLLGSKLRAAAMKKRLELIIAARESNAENDCHEHITYDEMELLCDVDVDELSEAELDFLLYMDEKVNDCDVCDRRYKSFVNTRAFFVPLSSRRELMES